jgi:hypothetical protein
VCPYLTPEYTLQVIDERYLTENFTDLEFQSLNYEVVDERNEVQLYFKNAR